MKRRGNLYDCIYRYENLCLAFQKACRGKQHRHDVIAFRRSFADNMQKLQAQLASSQPDVGRYNFFTIHDPKQRRICAAAFPERVLHHAVMNICEPYLESCAIFDSYACRKGKGNRKALARARQFARRYPWYLKLDIRRYFDSIDHDILLALLKRRFKDSRLMRLFRQLLATYCIDPGKGMPIGHLISQHVANFYLGELDHWIKETKGYRGYLRYMDDFILFADEKDTLQNALPEIRAFLYDRLALELKGVIQLNQSKRGIPFLGYRVFPGRIALNPRSRSRFVRKFRLYERYWMEGRWDEADLVRHMEPLIEFTRAANATGFRRRVIQQIGVPS